MANPYGVDVTTFAGGVMGLDPMFGLIEGERAVIESAARALNTEPGTLPHAPERGYNLISKLGARMTLVAKAKMKADIRAELLRDERILDAAVVDIVQTAGAMDWRLTIRLTLATGPFELVLGVSSLTVEILKAARLRSQ